MQRLVSEDIAGDDRFYTFRVELAAVDVTDFCAYIIVRGISDIV